MKGKLYRSKTDVKISGVCGGMAIYLNIDSTVLRLVWALLTLFTGGFLGIIMYIVCIFIMPIEPDVYDAEFREKE